MRLSEEIGSSLGITSIISGGIAMILMLFFFLIQSILIGPVTYLEIASGLGLILAPIAIITGLVGIKSDRRKIFAIIGSIIGIFLVMYHFMALTPIFTWIPA